MTMTMTMTRRSPTRLVAAGVLIVAGLGASESREPVTQPSAQDASREIMWTKLDLAHNVLDALAVRDFEAMEAYAEDLEMLGTAGFVYILDTEEYRGHAQSFRNAARALRRAAQAGNAEAGALAYMDLTLRCIRCHRSLDVAPK